MTSTTTRRLAAGFAVLLMVSARAETATTQPGTKPPAEGAVAQPQERPPAASPERKPSKKHGKSREARERAARPSAPAGEKAKPCEEVKPCAIE